MSIARANGLAWPFLFLGRVARGFVCEALKHAYFLLFSWEVSTSWKARYHDFSMARRRRRLSLSLFLDCTACSL
jgi:hypothetical protein